MGGRRDTNVDMSKPSEDMTDQPNNMTGRTRDGKGRFDRDLSTAERDAEAARLRARSLSYAQIAERLGISKTSAYEGVQRVLAETIQEAAAEVRQFELEKLDAAERIVLDVMERQHLTVSNGRIIQKRVDWERDSAGEIVFDGDGKPVGIYEDVLDDGPKLAAVAQYIRIQQRRAALLGLDAEKKLNLSGGVTYEVVGVDVADLT